MHAVRLHARVDASHRLLLDLPADVPEGEAEVIVLVTPSRRLGPVAVATPVPRRGLLEVLTALDQSDRPRLTNAEVDQWIADERAAWD
jgi:hypothetical protein